MNINSVEKSGLAEALAVNYVSSYNKQYKHYYKIIDAYARNKI